MKAGTSLDPAEAERLLAVMNRLYLPSANIELTLLSTKAENLDHALGPAVGHRQFPEIRSAAARPNGRSDRILRRQVEGHDRPAGSEFDAHKSVVVDDAPWQFIAPQTAWPPHQVTDDQLDDLINPRRTAPIATCTSCWPTKSPTSSAPVTTTETDNLMSMSRQDLKLNKDIVMAIGGK